MKKHNTVRISNGNIYIYKYNIFDISLFHDYIKLILQVKYYVIILNLKNKIQIFKINGFR
jgi:hypothetical protein